MKTSKERINEITIQLIYTQVFLKLLSRIYISVISLLVFPSPPRPCNSTWHHRQNTSLTRLPLLFSLLPDPCSSASRLPSEPVRHPPILRAPNAASRALNYAKRVTGIRVQRRVFGVQKELEALTIYINDCNVSKTVQRLTYREIERGEVAQSGYEERTGVRYVYCASEQGRESLLRSKGQITFCGRKGSEKKKCWLS